MICGRHWREVCVNGVGGYALSLAVGVCKWCRQIRVWGGYDL